MVFPFGPHPLAPSPAPAGLLGRAHLAGEGEESSKGWGEPCSPHPFEKPSSPLSAHVIKEEGLAGAERGVRGVRGFAPNPYRPNDQEG